MLKVDRFRKDEQIRHEVRKGSPLNAPQKAAESSYKWKKKMWNEKPLFDDVFQHEKIFCF